MQHHPGSWYLPWGVPLQKMLAVPLHPAAVGYAQPQPATACQVPSQQPPQQPPQQNFQHQIHPAAAAAAAALHHSPAALHHTHHPHPHHHPPHPHSQTLHPAAAAAMFTPLSLRTFITPSPSHLGLAAQQPLTPAAAVQPTVTHTPTNQTQSQLAAMNLNVGVVALRQASQANALMTVKKALIQDKDKTKLVTTEKRKADESDQIKDLKKAKLETKALKAKRPGFTDERYHETSYYIENGLRKVYPYYFTFTTFTKGRWVGEKILDVFAREFRAHPAEEYERCIMAGTLTVNYEKVPTDYRLKHNDLLANVVHRHEVPVTSQPITIVHMDDDIVVVNKPASIPVEFCESSLTIDGIPLRNGILGNIKDHRYQLNFKGAPFLLKFDVIDFNPWIYIYAYAFELLEENFWTHKERMGLNFSVLTIYVNWHETPVLNHPIKVIYLDSELVVLDKPCSLPVHPCGRYRHNTVVFILAKEYNLKNLRTIHRLDRLTSGLLLFGRSPKKARQMEHQIRNRQVQKEYVCRVEGEFPDGIIECKEPIEVVSYKIGVCKVSSKGKECTTTFQKIGFNGKSSVVLCKPLTGRMHQIRVHLQYLGYPVVNDPLYNHEVFGPNKGRMGDIGGKSDEQLVRDLINIHNAENWLGIDGDSELSLFKPMKVDSDSDSLAGALSGKGNVLSDDDSESVSREASPCSESPRPVSLGSESPHDGVLTSVHISTNTSSSTSTDNKVKVTVATQTGHESPDLTFNPDKMTTDKHCYECKVRYRDPKPQDLVMYLHAWKYKGPGWEYETELPDWARVDWTDLDCE